MAFNGVGNGATATATVVDGVVTGIAIVTPGSGYSTAPTVVLNEPTAPTQLWNNTFGPTDAALEEPRFAVPLEVRNGLYTVGLGDTAPPSCSRSRPRSPPRPANASSFACVWFDDGAHGFQRSRPTPNSTPCPSPARRPTPRVGGVSLANPLSSRHLQHIHLRQRPHRDRHRPGAAPPPPPAPPCRSPAPAPA